MKIVVTVDLEDRPAFGSRFDVAYQMPDVERRDLDIPEVPEYLDGPAAVVASLARKEALDRRGQKTDLIAAVLADAIIKALDKGPNRG